MVFASRRNFEVPNKTSRYHSQKICGKLKCASTGVVTCSRDEAERRGLMRCLLCTLPAVTVTAVP
jgi:hypothetical protein